jgi:hypothetical protein
MGLDVIFSPVFSKLLSELEKESKALLVSEAVKRTCESSHTSIE